MSPNRPLDRRASHCSAFSCTNGSGLTTASVKITARARRAPRRGLVLADRLDVGQVDDHRDAAAVNLGVDVPAPASLLAPRPPTQHAAPPDPVHAHPPWRERGSGVVERDVACRLRHARHGVPACGGWTGRGSRRLQPGRYRGGEVGLAVAAFALGRRAGGIASVDAYAS
jgi:hypothetical protein